MRPTMNYCHLARAMFIAFAALAATTNSARSQQAADRPIAGLNTVLPQLPVQSPRLTDGPDNRLGHEAEQRPAAPLSALVYPLRGNDASLEVIVGQGRLLTTKRPLVTEEGDALIAVGDPTVIDIDVLPNPKMIRVIGKRAGVTDLSVTTSDGEVFNFEIHVVYDIALLQAHLRQLFPNAHLRLAQMREHLVVDGQARDSAEVTRIIQTLQAYLGSVQVPSRISGEQGRGGLPPLPRGGAQPQGGAPEPNGEGEGNGEGQPDLGADAGGERPDVAASFAMPQIINLIRVPGVHQVLLKVRVAELNRTALRSIGSDLFFLDENGTSIGTQIGGADFATDDDDFIQSLALGIDSTLFGVFPTADFQIVMEALRQNSLLSFLAEPNLMAMSGQKASFLAGGQFPVPVPQGGTVNSVTIEFKDFGVRLDFVPHVLEDGTIRLNVEPEVSSIDFSIGTTLVPGGDPVPGVNTRKATTTVELRQGQTLAIAGLLQVDLDAQTNRIPGIGDLPILGTFFSNTTHERVEKELIVLVTPHLVSPVYEDQVAPLPGSEIEDPTDLEVYLFGRIEGRTGQGFRATTVWDDPLGIIEAMKLEQRYGCGPIGFSK